MKETSGGCVEGFPRPVGAQRFPKGLHSRVEQAAVWVLVREPGSRAVLLWVFDSDPNGINTDSSVLSSGVPWSLADPLAAFLLPS